MGDKEITVEFERITYNQEFANLCASESCMQLIGVIILHN